MSVTLVPPPAAETETAEQRFVIGGIRWDAYVAISDALDEHSGVRMIYSDGRLMFMGKSRRHERLAECLGHLVHGRRGLPGASIASRRARRRYRRRQKEAGVEGDRDLPFRRQRRTDAGNARITTSTSILRPTSRSKSRRATLRMTRSPLGAGSVCRGVAIRCRDFCLHVLEPPRGRNIRAG